MVADPWEILWDRAMASLSALKGFAWVAWAFGGGTAMRLFYDHRYSQDIDIFLTDAMVLSGLSPRLNGTTEKMTDNYTEQSNFLKLRFPEGEVDFIIADRLLRDVPYVVRTIRGVEAHVETPLEIVAKKCFYRAADFTARDVFDFAVLLECDPRVEQHLDVFLAKRDLLDARLRRLRRGGDPSSAFQGQMEAIAATPAFERVKATAADTVISFLDRHRDFVVGA